jgi:catechol 2,3-dioxygenase-like lactoylglutathione lyase family enzyme
MVSTESSVTNIKGGKNMMKVIVTSIFVQDQDKALKFYTETLGFVKKHDIPVGEHRWIALVSPEDQEGTELLLEPNAHPAAKEYQKKIFAEGIPATMFGVADVHEEYNRLIKLGVKFTIEPTVMGDVTLAVFDDTCGNLIQIAQN